MRDLVPHVVRDGVERLREGLHDTIDRFTGPLHRNRDQSMTPDNRDDFPAPRTRGGFPALSMEENEDEVRVAVELPGYGHEDFHVEVAGRTLCIAGERQETRESKEGRWHYSERRYGSFSRTVRLPCEVDADKVKANLHNGLLKIRLPKTEQARAKRIAVEVK